MHVTGESTSTECQFWVLRIFESIQCTVEREPSDLGAHRTHSITLATYESACFPSHPLCLRALLINTLPKNHNLQKHSSTHRLSQAVATYSELDHCLIVIMKKAGTLTWREVPNQVPYQLPMRAQDPTDQWHPCTDVSIYPGPC